MWRMPLCYRCLREIPADGFARDASKANGRKSICKGCDRLKSSAYYANNRTTRISVVMARYRKRQMGKVRKCRRCGKPATSSRHHYCDGCREATAHRRRRRDGRKRTTRGKTSARGYGNRHQALRKQWAPKVAAGEVLCARCGRPIVPGTPWDLGHSDTDRRFYTGPEHRRCNRATAGRRKHRGTAAQPARPQSRTW